MSIAGQAPETVQNAIQNFETAGIKPLTRPSLIIRVFMGVVAWVEGLNLKYSKVGNPPIYDKAVFPWIREIEREWRLVRGELDRVLTHKDDLPGFHELATDIATISQDHGWKSFMLCGYGFRSDRNIERCPKTWSICQKIPGLITVMFSIFEPGKHLPPHRGPYNGVLRLHLGLIVPEPREQLGIRVEKDIYRWKEGEAVVFDDAYEHEAWNYTPQTRVVHSSISASRCVSRSISSIGYCYISLCSPPSSARHVQREGLGEEILRGSRDDTESLRRALISPPITPSSPACSIRRKSPTTSPLG